MTQSVRERKIVYSIDGQQHEMPVPDTVTDAEMHAIARPLVGLPYERHVTQWQLCRREA